MTATQSDLSKPELLPKRPLHDRLAGVHWTYHLLIVAALIGASLFFIPPPAGVTVQGWHTLGLLIPVVMIWGTGALPVGVASALFLALVVAFHLVGADIAFKGFTNQLPWLIAGALAIGVASDKTGLSKRTAYFLLSHLRGLWGLIFGAYAANILMMGCPSVAGRGGVLAPVLRSIMKSIGDEKESNLSRLLTFNFCNATSTFLSNLILTGGVANTLMLAFYSSLTGHSLTWVQWVILMTLPTLVLCIFQFAGAVIFAPPERELMAKLRDSQAASEAYQALGPMTTDEWKVAAMFVLAIGLWVFGAQLRLDPGFAALIVMGLLFLPKIGVLTAADERNITWDLVLLIGAAVGVGGILDQTGMIKAISGALVAPVLNPLASFGLIGVAVGCILVGLVAHFILPSPANVTLAFPLLISWGLNTLHLPNAQVLAFLGLLSVAGNQVIMMAYQMPPYYVFLGMDVTNVPKFNGLLIKIYPFAAVGMLVGAYIVYGLITWTGWGI
jgi:DASS family divalent anion:Na+ symporter